MILILCFFFYAFIEENVSTDIYLLCEFLSKINYTFLIDLIKDIFIAFNEPP